MNPGLTRSRSWHNLTARTESVSSLWRTILLLWTLASLGAGALLSDPGHADLLTSSLTSDGTILSATTWQTGETLTRSSIIGTGQSRIERETGTHTDPYSHLQAWSAGPLLITEYSQTESDPKAQSPVTCVFANTTPSRHTGPDLSTTRITGILTQGRYTASYTLHPDERITQAEGQGIMDIRHQMNGNQTLTSRAYAAGNLTITDHLSRDQGTLP